MNYLYPRPPDPDHVAARGTDKYRDAVDDYQKWVAHHVNRNFPLESLIDKYDDFGNLSHDWKQWNDMMPEGSVSDVPRWLGEDRWNIGSFHKAVLDGGMTEWPPGSGKFFNDPGNNPALRKWYNEFGDEIGPSGDGGPDIDYNAILPGEMIKDYLTRTAQERANEAAAPPIQNAPPIVAPPPITNPAYNPGTISPTSQPPANQPTQPNPAFTGQAKPNNIYNSGPQPAQINPAYSGNVQGSTANTFDRNVNQPTRFQNQPSPFLTRPKPQAMPKRRVGAGWYSNWS